MSVFDGQNICVLDIITQRSAEDCQYCGESRESHSIQDRCRIRWNRDASALGQEYVTYAALGWRRYAELGLSIGGYYDYQSGRIHWFDAHTLRDTVSAMVERNPLMVSFNGMGFDIPLIADVLTQQLKRDPLTFDLGWPHALFERIGYDSYDILAEIWRSDPDRQYEPGLNSIDAIAQANGLGPKLSHGAQAPRDWAKGRFADVVNYCADDIYKTKSLFEMANETGGWLQRRDGAIGVRWIDDDLTWQEPQAIAFG